MIITEIYNGELYPLQRHIFFEQSNFTPIHGKPILKTFHNIWNEIKANEKSVYWNIGVLDHGHLSLVITDTQYALIFNTPFFYLTQPGPIIILDVTNAHMNSNIPIANTKKVCLFREVTRVQQALVQQIFSTAEEAYLTDILNRTTNLINDTISNFLTHLQDNYSQLMPHELFKRKDTVKKTSYNSFEPISSIFYAIKELFNFPHITGNS